MLAGESIEVMGHYRLCDECKYAEEEVDNAGHEQQPLVGFLAKVRVRKNQVDHERVQED